MPRSRSDGMPTSTPTKAAKAPLISTTAGKGQFSRLTEFSGYAGTNRHEGGVADRNQASYPRQHVQREGSRDRQKCRQRDVEVESGGNEREYADRYREYEEPHPGGS